jgi:hypothetical protein
MSGHDAYVVATVFTAIAGTKPEHGERLLLDEVLDGADYFDHAVLTKDDLEHGMRDLVNAGLASSGADGSFMLTDKGIDMWQLVWREYESRKQGNSPITIAAKRLKGITCGADVVNWSVTQQEYDGAFAAYRARFDENVRKLGLLRSDEAE